MDQRINAVPRIADVVAGELETRILEGSLKPGDRLPGERDLAVELGVSRPSLREAIQKLVIKGMLATRHGGGTYVTDHMDAPFVDPWQAMLSDHPGLQGDLLEFRHMLESQAASLAAERATDADIAMIDAAFMAMGKAYASNDMVAAIETDVRFHQAIADATHNVLIGHLTASLLRVIHSHVSRNLEHLHAHPKAWDDLEMQHHAIWKAIRERKPEVAGKAARAHIEFVKKSMDENAKADERRNRSMRRLDSAAQV